MSHEKTIIILNDIDSDLVEECAAYDCAAPSERKQMKKRHSRRIAAIILAACLVFALGITAYATGAIQSLIGKFWSGFQYEIPDDQLRQERPDYASWLDEQIEIQNRMLDLGEKAVQTRVDYPIPGTDGGGISLLEYYYDGEKIALACQFHRPDRQVAFDFDADSYPNLPFQSVAAGEYPSYLSLVKNQDELEQIQEKLQKDGAVSFLVSDCWLSDHVYANDSDLGPCKGDPDENGIFTIDPVVMGMGEVELPQDCQNREEITVAITYRIATYAFKLEGDAIQYTRIGLTDYPVRFTIPNLNLASVPGRWNVDALGKLIAGEQLDITQQIRGKSFTLQAVVPAVDPETLSTMGIVRLETDITAFKNLTRELLSERFPQIEAELEKGKTRISLSDEATGNLLLSIDCPVDGKAGYFYYVDVQRDLNGSDLDEPKTTFQPHYLTDIVPDGMELTGEEAAENMAALLSGYSCFQFRPWNVCAGYDQQKQQGYYRIQLQPEYQGFPVFGGNPHGFYSNQGIFAGQGLMLLKESQRTAIQSPLPLEQAMESVVNSIPEISSYDTVCCDAIQLGYLEEVQETEVVLTPAWIFQCSKTKLGVDHTNYFEIAVSLETGKLGFTRNGEQIWVDPA